MPILPPAGAVLKIRLKWIVGSKSSVMTHLYYTYSGSAPTAAALNTFCNTIVTAYNTNLQSLADSSTELVYVSVTDLSSLSGAVGSSTASSTGTRTPGTLAANVSLIQNLLVARRYRGGKPKCFWPFGVPGDISTAQTWATAFLNAFVTGFNAFSAALIASPPSGGGTLALANVSYYSGKTPNPDTSPWRPRYVPAQRATPVVDAVYNYTANPTVGSQRRRLRAA